MEYIRGDRVCNNKLLQISILKGKNRILERCFCALSLWKGVALLAGEANGLRVCVGDGGGWVCLTSQYFDIYLGEQTPRYYVIILDQSVKRIYDLHL